MSGTIPEAARVLAAQLERQFGKDTELARQLAEAQDRLTRANERLWSGLHPDGLAAVYGEHPAAIEAAVARARSEALQAPDPLAAVEHVRWSIHSAFADYQTAAESRRQLAADTGEMICQLVDTLVATGWTEEQARNADVHQLATAKSGLRAQAVVGATRAPKPRSATPLG
jgi:hypothetical protein